MNEPDRIERVLAETPRPIVVEGAHGDRLKEKLVQAAQARMIKKEQTMNASSRTTWKRHLRIAAVLVVCVLLVAVGWTAEKVYRAAKELHVVSTVESRQPGEGPLADPSLWAKDPHYPETETDSRRAFFGSMKGAIVSTDSDDVEGAKQEAAETRNEMKKLIVEKKYEFVKKFKGTDDEMQYVYQFNLSNGRKERMNLSLPLEKVSSWEDYLAKAAKQQFEREKLIAESIKAGRFRLVDVDVMLVHVCRDVASGEDILVQRIALPDGSVTAVARPPKVTEGASYACPDATWTEHLQAIRDGKRELLDVQTTRDYSYEITLPDGSTTIFSYGGEGRLAEAKK